MKKIKVFCVVCDKAINVRNKINRQIVKSTLMLGLVISLLVSFQQKSFASTVTESINPVTKLTQCIANKDVSCVKIALSLGANPDLQNRETGITILMFAISNYYDDEIVSLLIDNATHLNIRNKNGATALTYAAENDKALSTVKKLLAKGSDPNLQHDNGTTALIFATQNNNFSMVKMLLEKGANPNLQLDKGTTALMVAVKNNNFPMVEELLVKKADPNLQLDDGATAIRFAMEDKRHDIVKKLFSEKAILGIDQIRLFYNLRLFIETDMYNVGKYRRTEIFKNKFKNAPGHCAGLTKLWLYSKWASQNSLRGYDHDWFLNTVNDIANWDGESPLDGKRVDDFNYFLYIVTLFHDSSYHGLSIPQTDLATLFKESSLASGDRKLNKEYVIASTLTLDKLEKILKELVYDGKLVALSSLEPMNHETGLYKLDGNYYFYDSNMSGGEFVTSSPKEVAKKIFDSFNYKSIDPANPPAIGFTIYDFEELSFDFLSTKITTPSSVPYTTEYGNESCHHDCGWDGCHDYGLDGYHDSMSAIASVHSLIYLGQEEYLKRLDPLVNDSPLFPAAHIGCSNSTNYFLLNGAPINAALTNSKDTPVMIASYNGHLDVVRSYLGKVDLDLKNEAGQTALICASRYGFVDIVDALLTFGANPNVKGTGDGTALVYASIYGFVEVVERLLKEGALPNIEDDYGRTPIIHAAINNHTVVVEKLIDGEADPNWKNKAESTALMIASEKGYTEVVNKLLRKADPDIKGAEGSTALMQAIFYDHVDIAMKLLAGGANPNIQRDDGVTALMIAVQKGYVDLVRELLTRRADTKLIARIKGKDITAVVLAKNPTILSLLSSTTHKKEFSKGSALLEL